MILLYIGNHETNIPMLNSLQILRGFAAWMVVFHHIVQSYFMGEESNSFWSMANQYGKFGVDIFFVLSGYVMGLISQKYTNNGTAFFINRIYRIYPIYWFYTVLLIISILIFPADTYLTWWNHNSLLMSFALIPNLNPNGYGHVPTLYVGWTLTYEIFFYFLFALILFSKAPKPAITCACLLLIIAILSVDNNFLGHSSLLLIEFALGISAFIFLNHTNELIHSRKLFLSLIMICTCTLLAWHVKTQATIFKALLATDIVVLFVTLEPIFARNSFLTRFLVNLGNYSYSTYLNHIIIIGWFYYLFGTSESHLIRMIGIIATICSIYLVSKFSYRHIEKNTWINTSKQFIINKLLRKKNSL